MISKNNITRSVSNLKLLISRCESYGEFDKDGNLHLPVEKTERSFFIISKEKLNEYEANGMSVLELHQKLEEQADDCNWSDASLDIHIPKPKLRTKIFWLRQSTFMNFYSLGRTCIKINTATIIINAMITISSVLYLLAFGLFGFSVILKYYHGLLLAFTQFSEFFMWYWFRDYRKKYWLLLFPAFCRGTFKTIFNIVNTSMMWEKVVTRSHSNHY